MATVGKRNKAETSPPPPKNAQQPPAKHPGTKKPLPAMVEPMLSTLVREPFVDEDWMFEVKFGLRLMVYQTQHDSVGLQK
jgi:ATP-dependent DNA ligase